MREGEFRLTPSERRELRDRLRSRTLPAEDVRRARLILLLAQGKSYLTIRQVLGCNPNYISRWKGRFEVERLAGLYSHHPGRAVEKRTPALEARILEWTRRPAPDGATHWSSRKLARHLGISRGAIPRGSPQSPSPLNPDPTPLGSIRSKTGSPGSSAMSSPAVSSPRSRTWPASSCATSATTIALPRPSSGPTATPHGASALIPMSLLRATIVPVLTGRSQRITEPAKGKEPAM